MFKPPPLMNFFNYSFTIPPFLPQLCREWTETFPYDFRDERMMRSLKEMTQAVAITAVSTRHLAVPPFPPATVSLLGSAEVSGTGAVCSGEETECAGQV